MNIATKRARSRRFVMPILLALVVLIASSLGGAATAWATESFPYAVQEIDSTSVGALSDSSTDDKALPSISYQAHVQNVGDQDIVKNGAVAGTTGKGLHMEALTIWLSQGGYSGGIEYMAHVQGKGWASSWSKSGKRVGTMGKSLSLEALKIRLTGEIAVYYDVEYRVHVRNIGWQPWVTSGGVAGTTGKALPVEAVKIRLVNKSEHAKVTEGTYAISLAKNPRTALAASKSEVAKAKYDATAAANKFYVRNEADGITLQSVSTGRYLSDVGTVKLSKWSGEVLPRQVWTLSRDAGIKLTNKATGKELRLSSKGPSTSAKGSGFYFTSAKLLNNGAYVLKNAAKGMALDVSGASYKSGANIMVHKANGGGNQAFAFKAKSGGWYTVTCAMTGLGLDVKGGSKKDGANVRQLTRNNASSQQWKACLERDGNMYFINRASENALTVEGNGASGKNVVSSAYSAAPQQLWKLSVAKWGVSGDSVLDRHIASILKSHKSLSSCFDYVVGFRYKSGNKYGAQIFDDATTKSMAKQMIDNGGGNCYRFASLFSWLARGLGYSTNVRAGYVPSAAGGLAPHGWVEVYLDGKTYVCDPDLAHEIPGYKWFMTTYAAAPVAYTR